MAIMVSDRSREERGEGQGALLFVIVILGLAAYGGYTLLKNANSGNHGPRTIDVDGQAFIACSSVSVSKEDAGGQSNSFLVKFTDQSGIGHELHGVSKVTLTDLPEWTDAPMPLNPAATTSDGKPYVNGVVYNFSDGTKARFNNGQWEPVKVRNNLCPNQNGAAGK